MLPGVTLAQKGSRLKVPGDHATISAALDASAAGAVIVVAKGLYEETLTLKPGVRLEGAGANLTVVRGPGSDSVLDATDAKGAEVIGVGFEHPDQTANPGRGEPLVHIGGVGGVTLSACVMAKGWGDGVRIDGGKDVIFKGCEVNEPRGHGIRIRGAGVVLKDCKVVFAGLEGVRVESGSHLKALKVVVQGSKGVGLRGEGDDTKLELEGLISKVNIRDGLFLEGCRATLKDCEVVANDRGGVSAIRTIIAVDGGRVTGNKRNGLALMRGAKATVKGVEVKGNEFSGIAIVNAGGEAKVTEVDTSDNKHYGVFVHQGARAELLQVTADRNGFSGASAADEGTEIVIADSKFRDNLKHGVSVTGEAVGTLSKIAAERNKMQGVGVFDRARAKLVRSSAKENGSNGLQVWKGASVEAERNTFDKNKQSGIEINGRESRLKLKRNRCRWNTEFGVRFCSGAAAFKIGSDNQLMKNRRGKVGSR